MTAHGGALTRRLTHLLVVVASAVSGLALTAAVLRYPVLLLGLVGGAVLLAMTRSVSGFALVLLIGGPLLGSRFQVGPLTLDNVVTLAGLAVAVPVVVNLIGRTSAGTTVARLSIFPLALCLAIGVSGLANASPVVPPVVRYLGIAMVPVLIVSMSERRPMQAWRILLALTMVGILSVLTQPFLGLIPPYVDPDTGSFRYGGLFGHPNFAACVICLFILFLISRGRRSAIDLLAGAAGVAALLITGSLGALGTLAIALAIVLSKEARNVARGLLVGGLALLLFGQVIQERITFFLAGTDETNSITWRIARWERAIDLSADRRIFGLGWGQLEPMLGWPAHSGFVNIFVELGVVGSLIVLVGALFALARIEWSRFMVAISAFVMLASITDPVFYYPATLTMWLALSAAWGNQSERAAQLASRPRIPTQG